MPDNVLFTEPTSVVFVSVLPTFLAEDVNVMQLIWTFMVILKQGADQITLPLLFVIIVVIVSVENVNAIQEKTPRR